MAELKTKQNELSVEAFIHNIKDETMRRDCLALSSLMKEATHEEPKMWGTSIVGFSRYHYKYESGHEGDSCLIGFSPRKQALTLYIMPGFEQYGALLEKLGKYKTGKSCLYIKRIEDIHLPTLKKMIQQSVKDMSRIHS